MSDGMSDARNYGPSLSKHGPPLVCLEGRPLPAGWDGSPKGCWVQHPLTREICQLPPDGHKIHMRDDASGTRLLRWGVDES